MVGSGYVGTDAQQGFAVGLSSDGNTLISAGNGDNNAVGAVWVFTRSGTMWSQQGFKLVGTGYVGQSSQGTSVSISADGNTFVMGGYGDNNSIGALWVFTRTGTSWAQVGFKLVPSDYTLGNIVPAIYFGYVNGAAISQDGTTIAGGAPYNDDTIGGTWVFTKRTT